MQSVLLVEPQVVLRAEEVLVAEVHREIVKALGEDQSREIN
jgi:hypothetical protein